MLAEGDLEIVGRMRYSSNGTFLVQARADGVELPAIYKPRRGERPLWDFPDGTLCQREVASYEMSRALGWDIVPVTVLRDDGPLGVGALQRFVEHDPDEHYFTLLAEHEDRFRQFAVFDVLVNNTDRKGGHCLHDLPNDLVLGIDHGLTFHPMWKLRTVIWDFAERTGAGRARSTTCAASSPSSTTATSAGACRSCSHRPSSPRSRSVPLISCATASSPSPSPATTPSPGRWSRTTRPAPRPGARSAAVRAAVRTPRSGAGRSSRARTRR